MIVVDTNILLNLMTDTAETPVAHALFMRHRSLSLEAAKEVVRSAETLMQGRDFIVDSAVVLDLMARSCSAYDCEFVALAEALRVPLITTDREIVREFPRIARPLTGS